MGSWSVELECGAGECGAGEWGACGGKWGVCNRVLSGEKLFFFATSVGACNGDSDK